MYFTQDKITEIFYLTDEFCSEFQKSINGHLIGNSAKKKPVLSQSEVITILITTLRRICNPSQISQNC
jgi:hypothetical protein